MTTEESPHSKQKKEMLLHKVLSRSWQEAFSRDSKLVQKTKEDYCWENCLLSSEIHKIKETWTGWSKLRYANYAVRTLPKGLKFFCPVCPSESPKFMGLTSIHHPDALHHFNRVTHCPWCGKEGQNKGTVINHLQMTHYKLGLVCEKCLPCPSVTSEAIWLHDQLYAKEALTNHLHQPNH